MPLCPLGFLELCRALSRSPRETNARYSGTLPSRVDANKRDRRGPQNSKAALLLFLFLNAQPIKYPCRSSREKLSFAFKARTFFDLTKVTVFRVRVVERLITIETRQRSIRFLFLQERVKRDIINYAEMYCPRERVRERSTKSNGRKSSDSCQPVRFVSKKKVHHQEETNKKRNVK